MTTSVETFHHALDRISQKFGASSARNDSALDGTALPEELSWNAALHSGSLAVICLLAVVTNFLVAYTLVRKEQLLLPSNRLVFNLTASNFVFSLLILPFVVASAAQQKWLFGIFWCNFTAFFTLVVGLASILTSAMIAIDRYYAIVKPLMYTMTITTSKSTAMLLWVWIQACVCSFPPLFGWSRFHYVRTKATCSVVWKDSIFYTVFLLLFNVFLPFGVMVVCYYFIFQVARTKCRKIHVGTVADASESGQSKCSSVQTPSCQPRIHRLSVPRKPSLVLVSYNSLTKSMRTIGIVIGMFLVTWAPYVVTALVEAFCAIPACGSSILPVCATCLMYCSTIGYPIVYGVYNRSIRKEIQAYLCPPNSRAMKGLPRRNSRRLSFSGSLFDYSPFRARSHVSRGGSFDFGHASIDLGSIPPFSKTGVRRPSEDSGAIMTESDMDTDYSFFPAYWPGRHSAPAKSRLQHLTYKLNALRGRPSSRAATDQPFPILQIISVAESSTSADAASRDEALVHESPCDALSAGVAGGHAGNSGDSIPSLLQPVSQNLMDIPTIPTASETGQEGVVMLANGEVDAGSAGQLFIVTTKREGRGDSIDEGICNDCVLQDIN